ncbi:DHHA1 domain-containing protein, partial [Methylacidiphilum caldifontis]|uniref:DHHA1 domain-containing protein n=1 Tax=Methylacidiphilum caldifontis TaxID=2795386 RepID=UPI001ABD0F72
IDVALANPEQALAVIGLIADVMPLIGPARRLARAGLRQLREQAPPGLQALMRLAKLDAKTISASDIGFLIAPAINAPGRLESPDPAWQLLATDDPESSEKLAQVVWDANLKRRALTTQALAAADTVNPNTPGIIVANDQWPLGLAGLVAGQLMNRYDKPVMALAWHHGHWHGSIRNPWPTDIVATLKDIPGIIQLGGHPQAAGIRIAPDQLPKVQDIWNERLAVIATNLPEPVQWFDGPMKPETLERPEWYWIFDHLAPFGPGNPPPTVRVTWPT